jgi:hypothetical protein
MALLLGAVGSIYYSTTTRYCSPSALLESKVTKERVIFARDGHVCMSSRIYFLPVRFLWLPAEDLRILMFCSCSLEAFSNRGEIQNYAPVTISGPPR